MIEPRGEIKEIWKGVPLREQDNPDSEMLRKLGEKVFQNKEACHLFVVLLRGQFR